MAFKVSEAKPIPILLIGNKNIEFCLSSKLKLKCFQIWFKLKRIMEKCLIFQLWNFRSEKKEKEYFEEKSNKI